jgi:uncharacterized protein (TIGR00251 family)
LFSTNTWFLYDAVFRYAQPGARRNAFASLHGGRLKLQGVAPASESKANKRAVDLLSEQFHLPAAKVRIRHGRNSRCKTAANLGPGRDWLALQEAPAAL